MAQRQLVFIYGTLREGGRAHHLMAGAEWVSRGAIEGQLVHIDHYPGLVLNTKGRVVGDLYLVGEKLMRELDQYEGCFEYPPHYTRESVDVLLDNQMIESASVYVFQRLDSLALPLEWLDNGDWIEWYAHKKA